MKKFNIVLVLIAILLLVSSCKKEEVVVQATKEYPITLCVNDDSKATIVPDASGTQAAINFEVGDHVYLAYQGYCKNSNMQVTSIDGGKINFSGSIKIETGKNDDIDKSPLFFYFLGGVYSDNIKDFDYFTEVGLEKTPYHTTVCVSLQNPKEWNNVYHSPVLCFGRSDQAFSTGNKEYKTKLKNKCSLVKYSLVANEKGEEIPKDARVYIQGLNNVVEVDFKVAHKYYNNGDTLSEQFEGCDKDGFRYDKRAGRIQEKCSPTGDVMWITNIIIPNRDENNECYSILLPQKNVGKGKGNELFGYYFKKDVNGNYIEKDGKCVPIYLKVHFPYDNVGVNLFYECTIEVYEDQEAAAYNLPEILDYPYDA